MYHNPVLLNESIDGLAIKPGGIYVDVTYGGGGHSAEILKRLKKGRLIAFEQDDEAIKNRIDDKRLLLIKANFKYIKNFLNYHEITKVDGIIADLGVSSHQFDTAERGFSTRFKSELDMRMNTNNKLTAKQIINEYPVEELIRIFRNYGEIDNASRLAKTIAESRTGKTIETTDDLKEAINSCVPKFNDIKYFSKVFQAIRITVNDEIETLKEMLLQTKDLIINGGRLSVISYHSLEDRAVKNFIRAGNFEGEIQKDFYGNPIVPFKQISRKSIIPGEEEIRNNSRARSARLRIGERVGSLQ